MGSIFQFVFGFGNKTISIEHENSTVLPIQEVISKLYSLFDEEDKEINKLIPDGVEIVKTGQTTQFKSSKILTSLVNIGMPLEIAVKTLELVLIDVNEKASITHVITTKEIRQCVANAIREVDSGDEWESEEWSYRYTRKYGHDNRRIRIYNFPPNQSEECVSYSIIRDLMETAFKRIIPDPVVESLPRQHIDEMAQYILEFINGCDLYYIDYNILLAMIVELSRQPPHPWLITAKTREKICQYDYDAIQSNLMEIDDSLQKGVPITKYCYAEIIHHASSLILEKYEWFLGTEEYSSFYILKKMIEDYRKMDIDDILAVAPSMQLLSRDIALAGESFESLLSLMQQLSSYIRAGFSGEINNQELIRYGEIATDIWKTFSASTLNNYIMEDWSARNSQSILAVVSRVLSTLSSNKEPCHFMESSILRFQYAPLTIKGIQFKKNYYVVYVADTSNIDIHILKGKRYREQGNTILVLTNSDNDTENATKSIDEATNNSYWCIPMQKHFLRNLLQSSNPAETFYKLIDKGIYEK